MSKGTNMFHINLDNKKILIEDPGNEINTSKVTWTISTSFVYNPSLQNQLH